MGELRNFFTPLHRKTSRNYVERMLDDKVACMQVAKEYGARFWDGDRRYGYGGYRYDGRWEAVARQLIDSYGLTEKAKILDVGCGKGFLLHELKRLLPGATVAGFDCSPYALENAKEEVRGNLFQHRAQEPYPYGDKEFDLTISLTTLHNLELFDLKPALAEIERVSKRAYITVEGYRNEQELFNLQCWALTCASFYTPKAWVWLFEEFGYRGDYEFIYFE
ncbi:class I SAM-dependent methyltransferase [Citrifermentans bremense]|uniref:class I SAM-dependent methyltransferase n=1 Tax=Citrifermentans bremense TaxID=60035 RepID=UPI0004156237|nr:class I SAM-dependent methyltransferase [Citrifermentans bremense]